MAENDSTPQEKRCSCCNEVKPVCSFFKCAACKDGLRGECKACVKAKQQKYAAENKEEIRAQKRAYGEENKDALSAKRKLAYAANPEPAKARAKQLRLRDPDAYRESKRQRYQRDREQILVRLRQWRAENREIVLARQRAHASSPEAKERRRIYTERYREKIRSAAKAWKARNPTKIKPISPEYRTAWRKSNKQKLRIYRANRRALTASSGRLSPGLAERLFDLQKGRCACCGKRLGDKYHMDHIIPLALGGPNTDDNIQLLRARCNSQKNAKHPVDFMQERGYLL